MSLIEEYQQQHRLRNWEAYFRHIPKTRSDIIADLGCSIGEVSRILSGRTNKIIGIDVNKEFIEICKQRNIPNATFICSDLMDVDYVSLGKLDGVWASFSLSYLPAPLHYLRHLCQFMNNESWIALLDVACPISGNLPLGSEYYEQVKQFELDSQHSGVYDFNFGAKMEYLLVDAGFTIVHSDNDVFDEELNFAGAATERALIAWRRRLNRLVRLRLELNDDYSDFCENFIQSLQSPHREKRGSLRFLVAQKL